MPTSEYVIFSDKYHRFPDEKIDQMRRYALKFMSFEPVSTDARRAWRYYRNEASVLIEELPPCEVDVYADHEIEGLASLESASTNERIGQLRRALLKATTILTATPSDECSADFAQHVVGAFVTDLRAIVKRDGAFYSQEPLLIINTDGEMDPGAEADAYDESDEVPLPFSFASLGKLERVRSALNDRPELITEQDKLGRTILHAAIAEGRCEVARFLLEAGADPNASSKKCTPPLFHVYTADAVHLLKEFGAAPSATDKKGNSALHRPASQGLEDIVSVLVEIGVDRQIKNNDENRAVDLVDRNFYPELIELLDEAG